MYKFTIFLAVVAVVKAGFLHGNDHGALLGESFAAPAFVPAALPLPAVPASIYGPPPRAAASLSFTAPIAFPAPSYSAPITKTPSYAAPIGLPASVFRSSLAVAAPPPIYGAPAALPIYTGLTGW